MNIIYRCAVLLRSEMSKNEVTTDREYERADALLGDMKSIQERMRDEEEHMEEPPPAILKHIEKLIERERLENEMRGLQHTLSQWIESFHLPVDGMAEPRVKTARSVYYNFKRNWDRAFSEQPDFNDPKTYTLETLNKVVDDTTGHMIYVAGQNLARVFEAVYGALNLARYDLDVGDYGVDYEIEEGKFIIKKVNKFYHDIKIKLLPMEGKLTHPVEIKFVDKTMDDITRLNYRIRKEGELKKSQWVIVILGTANKMRTEVARKTWKKFGYSHVRLENILRAAAFVVGLHPQAKYGASKIKGEIKKIKFNKTNGNLEYGGVPIKIKDEDPMQEVRQELSGYEKSIRALLYNMFGPEDAKRVVVEADEEDENYLSTKGRVWDYTFELTRTEGELDRPMGCYPQETHYKFNYRPDEKEADDTSVGDAFSDKNTSEVAWSIQQFLADQLIALKTERNGRAWGLLSLTFSIVLVTAGVLDIMLSFMSYSPTTLAGTGLLLTHADLFSNLLYFIQSANWLELARMALMLGSGLYLMRWGRARLRPSAAPKGSKPESARLESAANSGEVINAIRQYQALGLSPVTADTKLGLLDRLRLYWDKTRLSSYLRQQRSQLIRLLGIGPQNLKYRLRLGLGALSPLVRGLLESPWLTNVKVADMNADELRSFFKDYLDAVAAMKNINARRQAVQVLAMLLESSRLPGRGIHFDTLGWVILPVVFDTMPYRNRIDRLIRGTEAPGRRYPWLRQAFGTSV